MIPLSTTTRTSHPLLIIMPISLEYQHLIVAVAAMVHIRVQTHDISLCWWLCLRKERGVCGPCLFLSTPTSYLANPVRIAITLALFLSPSLPSLVHRHTPNNGRRRCCQPQQRSKGTHSSSLLFLSASSNFNHVSSLHGVYFGRVCPSLAQTR